MNAFENERFEWKDNRKQLTGKFTDARITTGIEHDKWVLYKYKYPKQQFEEMVKLHQHEFDPYVILVVSIHDSTFLGADKGLFAKEAFKKGEYTSSN